MPVIGPNVMILITSVGQLEAAIHEFLDAYNEDPKPFVWSASVEAILKR